MGDGGNEIGMGRVEDYAIEGVVDHGENIACTVPTDQLVVAGTSNWGAHALVCAMRALGRSAVDPYLEPTWQERVLDVIVEYGGLDGVHMTNVATVDGLEPDRYFKQVGQLTDCARSWNPVPKAEGPALATAPACPSLPNRVSRHVPRFGRKPVRHARTPVAVLVSSPILR